ncbi:hypothetical protein [Agreia sp. COWG]|uniref:hypothetical protein n=1 Tax=Agreia sp. COWG TaxID=2773266 RepID=UPI0019284971|nr:hypothetical protein [Agreia sp. COWG]CAD5994460.1 exported protein of unknown function [Agreia sp. COWG]
MSSLKPRLRSFPNSAVLAVSTLTLLAAFFGGAAPAQAHVVDSDETSTASSELTANSGTVLAHFQSPILHERSDVQAIEFSVKDPRTTSELPQTACIPFNPRISDATTRRWVVKLPAQSIRWVQSFADRTCAPGTGTVGGVGKILTTSYGSYIVTAGNPPKYTP